MYATATQAGVLREEKKVESKQRPRFERVTSLESECEENDERSGAVDHDKNSKCGLLSWDADAAM